MLNCSYILTWEILFLYTLSYNLAITLFLRRFHIWFLTLSCNEYLFVKCVELIIDTVVRFALRGRMCKKFYMLYKSMYNYSCLKHSMCWTKSEKNQNTVYCHTISITAVSLNSVMRARSSCMVDWFRAHAYRDVHHVCYAINLHTHLYFKALVDLLRMQANMSCLILYITFMALCNMHK